MRSGDDQPSTISVLRLNFCVRDGNRWIPQAIVTGKERGSCLSLPHFRSTSVRPSNGLPTSFEVLACSSRFSHPQNRTGWRLWSARPRRSLFLLRHSLTNLLASRGSSSLRLRSPRLLSVPWLPSTPLFTLHSPHSFQDQALDRLVSPSSTRYRASTDDLSTLSSSRGLTCLMQWQFYSLGGLHA